MSADFVVFLKETLTKELQFNTGTIGQDTEMKPAEVKENSVQKGLKIVSKHI